MIFRGACALAVIALALLLAMLFDTHADNAILFSFVATPVLGLAIVLYALHVWRERTPP